MKGKGVLSVFLCVALVFMLLPASALAASTGDLAGLVVEKNLTIDLNGHGLAITAFTIDSAGIKVADGVTLTIKDSSPGKSNKLTVANNLLQFPSMGGGAAINVSFGSTLADPIGACMCEVR